MEHFPHPSPASLPGSGAAELGEIPGGLYSLSASLFHVLIRCLSQYPTLYLPGPTPRRGRVPLPQKGSAWSHELPGPRKPPVINYAAAPLCRCLSARWVCSQSFVSGFAHSSDIRLCTEVRRGAPIGQLRACSKSQQGFPSGVSGSALPLLTLT